MAEAIGPRTRAYHNTAADLGEKTVVGGIAVVAVAGTGSEQRVAGIDSAEVVPTGYKGRSGPADPRGGCHTGPWCVYGQRMFGSRVTVGGVFAQVLVGGALKIKIAPGEMRQEQATLGVHAHMEGV